MPNPINLFPSHGFAENSAATDADHTSDNRRSSGENASPHLQRLADVGQDAYTGTIVARPITGISSAAHLPHVDLAENEAVAPIKETDLRQITIQMRNMLDSAKRYGGSDFSPENHRAADFVRRRINENGLANRDAWTLSFNGRLQGVGVLLRSHRTPADGRTFLELESMAALPGSKGYGSAILQLAINYAQQCGHAGRIMVEPIQNSRPFFEAMGFEDQNGALYFDPAESEDWMLRNSNWVLVNVKPRTPHRL